MKAKNLPDDIPDEQLIKMYVLITDEMTKRGIKRSHIDSVMEVVKDVRAKNGEDEKVEEDMAQEEEEWVERVMTFYTGVNIRTIVRFLESRSAQGNKPRDFRIDDLLLFSDLPDTRKNRRSFQQTLRNLSLRYGLLRVHPGGYYEPVPGKKIAFVERVGS